MTTIPEVAQVIHTLLTTTATQAGYTSRLVRRADATLNGRTLTQLLVLGFLAQPQATLDQLSETACRLGVSISPQAIAQRLTAPAATCLQTVLQAAMTQFVASTPVAIPLFQRFAAVVVQDSTIIGLPETLATVWAGCGGTPHAGHAALKWGVQWDLLTGALRHCELLAGRTPDQQTHFQRAALPVGSLRLADLGFFDTAVLAACDRAGVYWLSKLPITTHLAHPDGPLQSQLRFVPQYLVTGGELPVQVGVRRVPARLLVACVPEAVAAARRRRVQRTARDKGLPVNPLALALTPWTILITNTPPQHLQLAEALVLARVRWQIELLFKLWKQEGCVDQWRSAQPWAILCELYAKLIGMLIQHWLLVVSCWEYPNRSLFKASAVVRSHAPDMASRLGANESLVSTVESLARCLARGHRINPRRKAPNTYQRVLELVM